jgi:hypothetical protein
VRVEVSSYRQMERRWEGIERRAAELVGRTIRAWTARVSALSELENHLRRTGRWMRGPSDFFGILRIAFDEVRHCRMLEWLLDPVGSHGLGERFLRSFLADVAIATGDSARFTDEDLSDVRVISEEPRGLVRADLVIYGPTWTVLIEAKIRAGEERDQGSRLEEGWRDEAPYLVFLTRSGRPMLTGFQRWIPFRWSQLAGRLRACLDELADEPVAEGPRVAREYLRSLEAHLS